MDAIRTFFTRKNVARKEAQETVKFPFVSASSNSEGNVTRKKPVQITGRPYDDDYKKHGFPTEAYPMKVDDANKGYGGYGNYDRKEGYKPTSSPTRNGKYDGYDGANKGYGNYNDKEGYKPTSDPPRNDNYGKLGGATNPDRIIPGGLNKPKLGTTGTTAAPRKGIPLSEATNDIEKIIGWMKEPAAIN